MAHLTTVDLSLRHLVLPQLLAVRDLGGEAIGISSPGPYVAQLRSLGVRHVPLASSSRRRNPLADLRAARELWSVLRAERPDVLHTHNPKPGLYGRVMGRLVGVPIVVNTVHGLYATPDDTWGKRLVVYLLETFAARFSDMELVQSAEDYALLVRWRITPPRRTRFLGNGVDLTRFHPDRFPPPERDRIRRELGVDRNDIMVGMVGRLVAEKGYPEYFEMAGRLGDRFKPFCIGPDDPDKEDALSPEVVKAAQRKGVRFLGMRDDVERVYAAMDIFVLPSHREGFPRAAMEATAMGLPVVASDIRGCREVVEHGVTGFLFPLGNMDALTAVVRSLGEDQPLRASMGEAAARRAVQRFDEGRVVDTVLRSYADVAWRKGVPWPPDTSVPATVRRARPEDAPAIARLHVQGIGTGFLAALGPRFLEVLYRALIGWEDSIVLIAEQGRVVGFVSGVADTGGFYGHFLRRHAFQAFWAMLPHLFRPSVLRRIRETLGYGSRVAASGELLSVSVDTQAQGSGIGRMLCEHLLAELAGRSADPVRVVVGAANSRAVSFYESLGFVRRGELVVHRGETSLELLWSSSA